MKRLGWLCTERRVSLPHCSTRNPEDILKIVMRTKTLTLSQVRPLKHMNEHLGSVWLKDFLSSLWEIGMALLELRTMLWCPSCGQMDQPSLKTTP